MRYQKIILSLVAVLVLVAVVIFYRQASAPSDPAAPTPVVSSGHSLVIRVPTAQLKQVESQYGSDQWLITTAGSTWQATSQPGTDNTTLLLIEDITWQPSAPVTLQLSLRNTDGVDLYSTQLGAPAPADANQDFVLYWKPETKPSVDE